MILLTHNEDKVIEIIDLETNQLIEGSFNKPIKALFYVADHYKERLLVWCHESFKPFLNIKEIKKSFHLKNMMMSYSRHQYLPEQIGYVEDSPFLKVNKSVKYPTWLMSSNVGAIYASQLLKFKNQVKENESFDFVLNSIAKLGMPKGLFCYSEPKLLRENVSNNLNVRASYSQLFKFVKHYYKGVWSVLLFFNFIIYDSKFLFLSFLKTIFIKKVTYSSSFSLEALNKPNIKDVTIDVIIPTLGRKKFLQDVLLDLEKQTLLPKQVIIIEQNGDKNSKTELEFISNKSWPFKIIHKFINQTGACNARNLALQSITADYVYLADDDNKFDANLLKSIILKMQSFNFNVIAMSYLQKNELEKNKNIIQWTTFGGGSSVIASKYLETVSFNMAYEFGYGEDTDFGMQLRNLGADIIYTPDIKILHLKAPIGGFRTKFIHPWEKSKKLKPKPSPTVMLSRMTNTTKHQLLGYKTGLFIKYYKSQNIKNPFKYYIMFKKQWQESVNWANTLKNG
ncbi:glycosyltransferase family 2 protein [Algibacter amylolyticus]|uniref:Glycosyltransferase family 2 protein n=1 Tax=Algibacter amylolyticus TaxID=1608400 RepID=A0A5M7B0Z4_9FLAO|nr:glycosyltransferase family A protein [Algibacter amylolyticus]KAA5822430.1 glycosyltransferase family 2 protein [Algibacter amylolyticus]MBB5269152.1 glycosyltransferase involved in cell wall biosynthesis [Algibacter amylolyticus]TSJ73580.1 glycosyltransferase family 2 protein [Algibacter amylolyticus]